MKLLTLLLCLVLPAAAWALPAGAVGVWTFENVATDASGNGNDGTLTGDAAYGVGKVDTGIVFGGAGGVNFGAGASLDLTGRFTISLWNKLSVTGQTDYLLERKAAGAGNYAIIYGYVANKYELYSDYYVGDVPRTEMKTAVNDTLWHNLTVTYDSATVKWYLDGVLDTSSAKVFAFQTYAASLYLGRDGVGNSYIQSTADNLYIWNRALDQAEVTEVVTGVGAPTDDNADFTFRMGYP